MRAHSSRSRARLQLEPLENRAVPATLLNARTVTYQESDGDIVTVAFSRAFLTSGNANSIFTFDTGSVDGNNTAPQQLRTIDLANLSVANGTGITVTARRTQPQGDGFANVGLIDATGIDLASVAVRGDMGKIIAGNADLNTPGLGALVVQSIGRFGADTGGGDLESAVTGRLGRLHVASDFVQGKLRVFGSQNGSVGIVSVGGSYNGWLVTEGRLGSATIGGDIAGVIIIKAYAGSFTVGGSIIGGPVSGGLIDVRASAGSIVVRGNVIGGAGNGTGQIYVRGSAALVAVGGSVIGANGYGSGRIQIDGVGALVSTGRVTVRGSLLGGSEEYAGLIYMNAVSSVSVLGDVKGGSAPSTGLVRLSGKMETLSVGGSVQGGSGSDSGQVTVGTVRLTTIGGDVIGGSGNASGYVGLGFNSGSLSVAGSVRGGTAIATGNVGAGGINSILIGGDIVGAVATADGQDLSYSGNVHAGDHLLRITVGGSVIGGSADGHTGVTLAGTGEIHAEAALGTAVIRGSLIGRDMRARIFAYGQDFPGPTTDLVIGSVTVFGRVENADIVAGYGITTLSPFAPLNGNAQIGRIVVYGDWIASNLTAGVDLSTGNAIVDDNPLILSRIGYFEVRGHLVGSSATGDTFLIAAQQIGKVVVGGNVLGPLTAGAGNDHLTGIGVYQDIEVKEVA